MDTHHIHIQGDGHEVGVLPVGGNAEQMVDVCAFIEFVLERTGDVIPCSTTVLGLQQVVALIIPVFIIAVDDSVGYLSGGSQGIVNNCGLGRQTPTLSSGGINDGPLGLYVAVSAACLLGRSRCNKQPNGQCRGDEY